ncbi:hypothetical protein [Terrabacter sp. C0L_2]|uniref:hypothetical protein n=1 Tax=Terrabacter sp. C0L_2 TaxID=3108389 RepID=UPI00182646F0|nr:hypothetical protein [Dermatophilaceae bacterium]WVM95394.1 hypothetical protein U5C87_15495 [Terrabacter sp. C0L_2]
MTGMLQALISACRSGVPLSILQGTVEANPAGTSLYSTPAHHRAELLRLQLADAERRIKVAVHMVMSAMNEGQLAEYRDQENQAREDAEHVQQQLASLEAHAEAPSEVPAQVPTLLRTLELAFQQLNSSELVTQEQFQALRTVMPHFILRESPGGGWEAEASLRLPTPEGAVVEIGPVRWPVGGRARSTSTRVSDRSRNAVPVELIQEAGLLGGAALYSLRGSLLAETPWVVLNGLTGHPFPEWVGPQWREKPLVDWLTRTYRSPDLIDRRYIRYSVKRQFLLHACPDEGDLCLTELRRLAPVRDPASWTTLAQTIPPGRGDRRTEKAPSLTVSHLPCPDALGERARLVPHFRPLQCQCGRQIRSVVLVPEVPRGLVCACGRMPDANQYGMPDDVRLPAEYVQVLTMSRQACEMELRYELDRHPYTPTPQAREIMDLPIWRPGAELTLADVKTACRPHMLLHILHRMQAYGLIERRPDTRDAWVVRDEPEPLRTP